MTKRKTPSIAKNHADGLCIIAAGASAGGLEALQDFLSHFPTEFDHVAIVVAQHLSASHKSMLVPLLSRKTHLNVTEAAHNVGFAAGTVYITPPDRDISIKNGKIRLAKPSAEKGPKPSVDVLFKSLAGYEEGKKAGVILSGTGNDGAEGIQALKDSGALIVAQSPESARSTGMPQAAIKTGKVDIVLPPVKIGRHILGYVLGNKGDVLPESSADSHSAKSFTMPEMVKETLFSSPEHPCVVIDEHFSVLNIYGDVRLFMTLPSGSVNANLFGMVNPELQIELRALVGRAMKNREPVTSRISKFELYGDEYYVRFRVKPMLNYHDAGSLYVVVFERLEIEEFIRKKNSGKTVVPADDRVQELEEELAALNEQLQAYIDQIEASNVELQSLNEELQSTNEELHSANEELETANEELQSTNEEAQVAYSELKAALFELKERSKEQNCLFRISSLDEFNLDQEELLEQSIALIREGLQHPGKTGVRILVNGEEFTSEHYKDTKNKITAESHSWAGQKFMIELTLTGKKNDHHFLEQEKQLIATIADLLALKLSQKEARQSLERSNERYEYILQATSDAIWEYDAINDDLIWGEGFKKMFGYEHKNEVKGINRWLEKLHPDDVQKILESVENFLYGNVDHWNQEYRFRKSDGSYVFIKDKAWVLRDKTGKPVRVIGAMENISQQKFSELKKTISAEISHAFNNSESLKEALDKMVEKFIALPFFQLAEFWIPDNLGKKLILTAKKTASEEFSVFHEESKSVQALKKGRGLPGKAWKNEEVVIWKNLDKKKANRRREAAEKAGLKTGFAFPVARDGETIGVLLFAITEDISSEPFFVSMFSELTDAIASEINRKSAEEQLSRIFNSAPDIICIAGLDGYYKKVNPAMCEFLGYTEEELLTAPILDFIHTDDRERTSDEIGNLKTGGGNVYFENRLITKSGNVVWVSWTTKPFYNEGITYSVGKNVTELKAMEELLNQASKLAMIGSWDLNPLTGDTFWSEVTRQIFEVEKDFNPTLENALLFFKEGEHRDTVTQAVETAIAKGTSWDLEVKIVTAKGNEKWVRSIGETEIVGKRCVRIYGSLQDIQFRKTAELKLVEKTRHLDAVSKLNSALIHYQDWYNALNDNMEIIGNAVNADRVYYFENHFDPETGEGFTTQILEWCREGIIPQMDNPDLDAIPFTEVPELIDPMVDHRPSTAIISEVDQNCTTRHVMETQQIKAFLAIPLIIQGQFHGFVGFDNCTTERYWSEEETEMLRTIASNLSTAIERYQFDKEHQKILKEKNTILESISDAFYAINDEWNFTYFNKEAENLLKTDSSKLIGTNIRKFFTLDEEQELFVRYKEVVKTQEASEFEFRHPILGWFSVSVYPSGKGLSVYFKNITEKKIAEKQVIEKSMQLDAIATFNGLLLKEETSLAALEKSFEMIGEIVNADRVYYFENKFSEKDNAWSTSLKMEWTRSGFEPQIDNPEMQHLPFDDTHPSIGIMAQNKPYSRIIDEIEVEEFREMLKEQKIVSVLSLPIFVDGHFHGFIGFDECKVPRRWSDEEIGFLNTISLNLASALENEAAKKKIVYKSRLIETIATVNSTLLANENWLDALDQTLGIIGKTVGADRVYYFENQTDPKTGEPVSTQLVEWVEEGISPEIDNEEMMRVPYATFREFMDVISGNETYAKLTSQVQDDVLREILVSQDILSILIIPIFVNQEFWGFIGFDDCTEGRTWTDEEISFLRSVTINVSNAIKDHQADRELRKLYRELEENVNELAASNSELEQFAFVASHDLQEPLRMITSFLTQLERKYGDIIDDRGKRYIHFATDGAVRMRQIILDLLEYSRVGRVDTDRIKIDINEVLSEVKTLNRKLIQESGAKLSWDSMPVIYGAATPVQQLFQNLIQNALKYQQKGQRPVIKVRAEDEESHWKFFIQDNGIGIPDDYKEKIFNIFQRLHGRDEFSGTGVGLAICKKVVEDHGGTIGVDSEPDKGSTFFFTIKKPDSNEA